jgi:hypothetical protein
MQPARYNGPQKDEEDDVRITHQPQRKDSVLQCCHYLVKKR